MIFNNIRFADEAARKLGKLPLISITDDLCVSKTLIFSNMLFIFIAY